ncbi:MAG: hypothetical protein ABF489_04725 [Bifidobacterium sp.]|uniref:hypothetical protein n=1 Tax=Bifidobacterium sp. TaxID=41200 RepID=UPI0039EB6B63
MKFFERPGMKRGLLAAGAILGIFTLITAATLTDYANVNLGSNGFAPASDYNIQVSVSKETSLDSPISWVEGDTKAGVSFSDDEDVALAMQSMEPGNEIDFTIPVRNASEEWASTLSINFAEIQAAFEKEETDEEVLAAKEAFIKALELSYCMSDTPLTGCDDSSDFTSHESLNGEADKTEPVELIGDTVPLAAFDGDDDALYNSGEGNVTFVVVKVKLGDEANLEDFKGASDADIQVQFTGTAV